MATQRRPRRTCRRPGHLHDCQHSIPNDGLDSDLSGMGSDSEEESTTSEMYTIRINFVQNNVKMAAIFVVPSFAYWTIASQPYKTQRQTWCQIAPEINTLLVINTVRSSELQFSSCKQFML